MFFPSMYTFIIQCVYVDSQRKSWSKRTEARVTNEQTKERTHHLTFLNLYIDYIVLYCIVLYYLLDAIEASHLGDLPLSVVEFVRR